VKIAALYDVHGMPWALEAVLSDVDADVIVCGGDILFGPYPASCVDLMRDAGAHFVRGNAERAPSDWDRTHVESNTLAWLAALPLRETIDGVVYCHAAPDDDMPITTIFTPDDTIAARFAPGTTVIGHTHHQFERRIGDVRIVNAGSVGMPYEGEVAAYWTLVEDGEPSFRHTPFDIERAIAEIEASGWPAGAEFVAENLRVAITAEDAARHFEGT